MGLHLSEYVVRSILAVLVNFLILAGNAIVVLAFYRYKHLRSISHLFILNLALADILLGLLVAPFITAAVITRGWKFGQLACDFQGAMTATVSVASVLTLTFMSLEKKLAICNPWYHYVHFNSRKVAYLFVAIWIICSLLAVTGFLSSKYVFTHQFMICMIDWNETLWVTIYAVSIHFFLPFLLLVYSNISIIKVLRRRRRVISTSFQHNLQAANALKCRGHRERKAWRLLSTVVLAFVLCWAPYYISVVCWTLSGDACPIPERICFYFVLFSGVNSCINPLIYAVMNNSFRQAFFKLLHIEVNSSRKCNELKSEAVIGSDKKKPSSNTST